MITPGTVDTLAAQVNGGGLAEEQATSLVLSFLDEHMRLGDFVAVGALLDGLDPDRLNSATTVAVLSLTWHAREHIVSRPDFVRRSAVALLRELGTQRASALLATRS